MPITYPTRCLLIDADGSVYREIRDSIGRVIQICRKNPEPSKPHIGKKGIAERLDKDGVQVVQITLDDNTVILGSDCWWLPLDENDQPTSQRPRSTDAR